LRNAFIELHGDLGAGKTTLVRHLLRALGVQGRVKSPTYAVVEPHEVPGLAIWHFDFYRFTDPREWEDAGFRDVFASPGLKLAEWPRKRRACFARGRSGDPPGHAGRRCPHRRADGTNRHRASLAERRNGMTQHPPPTQPPSRRTVLQAGSAGAAAGPRAHCVRRHHPGGARLAGARLFTRDH
jgi:hypothetical protein